MFKCSIYPCYTFCIRFRAMGLQDTSGNIYEMLDYTFFNHADMGTWETMMDGMVNVSVSFHVIPREKLYAEMARKVEAVKKTMQTPRSSTKIC